jgi:hypothetical protein
MEVCGLRLVPSAWPPRKIHGTLYTRGWVVLKAGLDGCRKSRPHRDSIPRTVQPVASRYMGYAIPSHFQYGMSYITVTFSKCGLEERIKFPTLAWNCLFTSAFRSAVKPSQPSAHWLERDSHPRLKLHISLVSTLRMHGTNFLSDIHLRDVVLNKVYGKL